MAYTERANVNVGVAPAPVQVGPVVDYHDRVRWAPILAGIVVAIVCQLMLSALGASIGGVAAGEAGAGAIGTGLGIWAVISLLISLFLGSWTMAAACGPMNGKTAMLNGTILWATTIVISGWLLASGVSGTFGVLASNAGGALTQVVEPGGASLPSQGDVAQAIPDVSAAEAAQYAGTAAKAGFTFLIGSLLGLAASLAGATFGARKPRATVTR